ncbi:MAG: TolC family protein [Gammaproteobacteria bacterium]
MRINKYPGTVFAICYLTSLSAVAEIISEAPALQAVVQAAYERYPALALPDVVRQQGQAIRRQASGFLADDPSLSLRHETDEVTDNFGFNSWEANVKMPLWLPGQRKRSLNVANAVEQEAESLTPFYKWRVSGEVRELLWSIRIAEANEVLARAAVDSAQALKADIDKRVQAGELALTDQILADKERLVRDIELITRRANVEALRKEYRMLTGLIEIPEDILEQDAEGTSLPETHPAIVVAGQRAGRAQTERDRARHEKRSNPVLALGARNERAESGLPHDTIMSLELSLPLGLKYQSASGIADAQRQLVEQKISYASVQRELEKQLILAGSEKHRTAQALKLTQRQQRLAAEGLRLAQRAFELGESNLFTLLQARTQALAAERDLLIRQLEQGRAVARHNQALGVILE